MKKLLVGSLLLALTGTGVVSCKKEKTTTAPGINKSQSQITSMSSNGKILVFSSVDDYKKIVENPSDEIQKAFLKEVAEMPHVTYAEKMESTHSKINYKIMDDYLAQILNEDRTVQIGNFLYHVDNESEKVFVLQASHINEYKDLVAEKVSNVHIHEYPTNVNVIDLVEGKETIQKTVLCHEDGAGRRDDPKMFAMPTGSYFMISPAYIFGGIYFSVNMTATSGVSLGSRFSLYIQFENLWYHQRCGTTTGPVSHPWWSNGQNGYSQVYVPYRSTTALNGYYIKARARMEDSYIPSGSNPYSTYFTDWGLIQVNN